MTTNAESLKPAPTYVDGALYRITVRKGDTIYADWDEDAVVFVACRDSAGSPVSRWHTVSAAVLIVSPAGTNEPDLTPSTGGVQAIARERTRQIAQLGYTPEHDERHFVRDLVGAATVLLDVKPVTKPAFTCRRDNPDSGYYSRDDLVRAGALIAAAIDRLDRAERS